ncbi:MAG: flagellar motor protein MotB [Bryobacterales bacterium]
MELEPDEPPAGAPEWMVTFADLMSLLLTFFVLLLSFSNMEITKFRTMAGSVRNALGLKSEFALSDIPTGSKLLPHMDPKEGEGGQAAEQMKVELKDMVEHSELKDIGTVEITPRGVVLRLKGDSVFDSGQAEIKPAAIPFMDRLAGHIATVPNAIDVEGHTDNVPIATDAYPSNWELSAARAGRAARHLAERGAEKQRLRAVGRADTIPVAPNENDKGRATNRRVEFVFLADGGIEDSNPPPTQAALSRGPR